MVELRPLRYRLAIVFNTLFFPFTFPDVLEAFKAQDFSLAGTAIPRVPVALGAQLYIAGPMASKKEVIVDLDHDRKIVGAEGRDVGGLCEVFDEVVSIVQENFHINLERDVDYVELSAAVFVKTDKVARESIERVFAKDSKIEGFKSVLGFDPVIRSFTLSERGKPPEGKAYVEFNITHRLTALDTYFIQAVFRHPKVSEAVGFTKSINEKVTSLIKAIEA